MTSIQDKLHLTRPVPCKQGGRISDQRQVAFELGRLELDNVYRHVLNQNMPS